MAERWGQRTVLYTGAVRLRRRALQPGSNPPPAFTNSVFGHTAKADKAVRPRGHQPDQGGREPMTIVTILIIVILALLALYLVRRVV
jgi:hypothetical protein